ncbi:unnamed protein product [Boreogadus saida]
MPELPDCRQSFGGSIGKGILAAVRQLRRRRDCTPGAELLGCRRAPPAGAAGQLLKLPHRSREYNPLPLHVAVKYGLQKVKSKVPFPQFFSTMAEMTHYESLLVVKISSRSTPPELPDGFDSVGRR